MRSIKSLYTSARRYKRALSVHDRDGAIIVDLIDTTWMYRHGSRSDKLHEKLEDVVERAKIRLKEVSPS